jgi:hypothetical protein
VTAEASPPTRPGGRVNIAFTKDATEAAKRLIERFTFTEASEQAEPDLDLVDAARIGTAFALRVSLPMTRPDNFGPANGSNFNVGSIDPGGELRDLLQALHPDLDEDPYRVVETLMSVGVLAIDERLEAGDIHSLRTLISPEG